MLWFSQKKIVDLDALVLEKYRTDFGLFQKNRFPLADADGYSTTMEKHAMVLTLYRKSIFSWVPADMFQYRDFILEACVELPFSQNARQPGSGLVAGSVGPHCASGLIFRYNNNENFYYFLLSNHGMFRFDVLFNNHPMKIIEWTSTPHIVAGSNNIRIIGRGSHFSFYINDEWVAEISDETLASGKVGLAAQNYEEADTVSFKYTSFQLDSRPLEVEKSFLRWVKYIPAETDSRLSLAKTLIRSGNFTNAAVQLKKILKASPTHREAGRLFCETCINLTLFDEAMAQVDLLIANDPGNKDASLQKANLFYLTNRFMEGRDFCRSLVADIRDSSYLWNLLGNCEYALGNWDKAAEAYSQACAVEPGMPFFLSNNARALERQGKADKAAEAYLAAADILFRQEAYTELEVIFPRILALQPGTDAVKALKAKMLFHENKIDEARALLEELVAKKYANSAVYFLYGLILIEDDKREEALPALQEATVLQPDFALYWWRLGECKRLLDMDYQTELEKAYELAPEDPWVNNLYGLAFMDSGDLYKAEQFLLTALAEAPLESDIITNLAEILFLQKRYENAFVLIEESIQRNEDAPLWNLRGNLHVRQGEYPLAVGDYEEAIKLEPDNPLFRENCAAACIEADMYSRADELLVGLVDTAPSASAFNLLGNLGMIRGEFTRAQLCYEQAMAFSPDDIQIKVNLAALFADKLAYDKAKALLDECLKVQPEHPTANALLVRLRRQFEVSLSCAECGRTWWVARSLPPQELGKVFGEPPAEAPAGKCPDCGKIYCIACAEHHLKEKRFFCPDCDSFLKLSDDQLKYLLIEYLKKDIKTELSAQDQAQDNPPAQDPAIFKPE
ncbi:MAG: tetratricopeptide repeat protein [Spirochaetaceae bacterium]|nr:MAG: tetratricopeptide repeat protein [Spirochaetaceae bacterium]